MPRRSPVFPDVVVPWNWTLFYPYLGGFLDISSLSEPEGELKLYRGQVP